MIARENGTLLAAGCNRLSSAAAAADDRQAFAFRRPQKAALLGICPLSPQCKAALFQSCGYHRKFLFIARFAGLLLPPLRDRLLATSCNW